MTEPLPPDRAARDEEARLFARHLLGCEPGPAPTACYAQAHAALFPTPASAPEEAVLAFARRHPWALGPLDAAAALLQRDGLLRRKLLVMCAVLETSPEHAEAFLPRPTGRLRFLAELFGAGLAAALHAAAGLVLWPWAVRRH